MQAQVRAAKNVKRCTQKEGFSPKVESVCSDSLQLSWVLWVQEDLAATLYHPASGVSSQSSHSLQQPEESLSLTEPLDLCTMWQ